MSTPGKVLTVLVALAVLGGVFLTAKVSALNSNWGQRIDQLSGQVTQLDQDFSSVRGQVEESLAQVRILQEKSDKDLVLLRTRVSDLEKFEADSQEAIERANVEMKRVDDQIRDGKTAEEARGAELAQTRQDLESTRQVVEQQKVTVDSLVDSLKRLQTDFVRTVDENRRLLDQLRANSAASGNSGRVRAAALRR
jgi:chromosome segregation ATPase